MMRYYNEIVPYELSVELKTSGFDEVTKKCYGHDYHLVSSGGLNNTQLEHEYQLCHFIGATLLISAPTFADVFDWLFSKGIYIQTTPVNAIWDSWRKNIYYKHSEYAYKSLNPNANLSIESFIKDSCDSIRKALDIIKQEKEERK